MTAPTLVVNTFSGVVHRDSCKHARNCIPWVGHQVVRTDRACGYCKPELGERP